MFKKSLSDKLKRIFDLSKVSFDLPSDEKEQECIFIQVDKAACSVQDDIEIAEVTGKIRIFASSEKLPYGYFAKRIASAAFADTKDLFFYNMEENSGEYVDIVERNMAFVYIYNSQYDPDVGTITSINLTEQVS